jgi:amino acid adenylation domain-containing protein
MKGTASSPKQFSSAKQLLLEKRLQGAMAKAGAQTAISPYPRQGNVPLSFAQQRLWFLDQLISGSAVYNISEVLRLKGSLDAAALEWSLNEIVKRHESLRTTFSSSEGQPFQVIAAEANFKLPIVNLEQLADSRREQQMQQLALEESKKPFDLARDLMIRGVLIRLQANEHVLIVTMHHIVSDAWSLGVFYQELAQLYEARIASRPAELPQLTVQYADYALWQRESLQGKLLDDQLLYWKKQLAGAPDLLELPTDKQRPAAQSFRGGAVAMNLPPALNKAIKQLSRKEGATVFMTLLAAFKTLLHRYTGQSDIVVGSPIAGRTQIETEALIGFFVNTLVLRNQLAGNPTFRELLQRVRKVTLDAYAHQDLPFEKLVMELKPERSSSHSPLFQVMFVLQNAPAFQVNLSQVSATPIQIDNETAKFDLIFSVTDAGEEFQAGVEYSLDIFEPATISRMLAHFRILLEGICANPDARLSELPLLSESERHTVLVEWNETATNYPRHATIHELFERQAELTPDAPALIFNANRITYGELNVRANQVAQALRRLGAGPGSLVGVSMERSVEMIVSLLGILKAGGAYVSLDPTYPAERLALMIEDVQPAVLLAQKKFYPAIATRGGSGVKVLCVDDPAAGWQAESSANVSNQNGPEDLAYVSFTSGSTGRPKGVCVPHRAVVRLVRDTNYVSFSATDVFLQLAPISFDASTLEIWGPLLNGARLVIYPPETPALSELADAIDRHGVTTLWLTSGLFQQMVEQQLERLQNVKQLLAGGDVLPTAHVRKALEGLPNCRLINGYGPTENTTFTCCHAITLDSLRHRSIPIGKPIANTQVYILDEHGQPTPPGIPGELYAGGDGLARGYLKREQLTAEKFVPNPCSTDAGARLYKTGDLARWLPGGEVEFLGRLDGQVKIRGFRVEPAEIETILGSHPKVRECIVTVDTSTHAGKRLVSYFVAETDQLITGDELREFLRAKLPDYMVPAFFVPLSKLPLNANGKVDRKALPPPEESLKADRNGVAPRDEIETELTALWQRVLGVNPISVRSNFFELGGHSLLAVQLVAQIERAFGRKVTVAALFQAPTVEQLAGLLRGQAPASSPSSLVEIQPKGSKPPMFFIHGVGGGMFWGYTNLSHHLGNDQPVYALKSRGMDGAEEFGTIEEMASHYLADIRRVQPHGPYYLGGYCFGGNVAFEMAQQLKANGEEVAFVGLINSNPPNGSYAEVRWTPAYSLKFFKNLIDWARHSFEWAPAKRREFIRWKLRSFKKRMDHFWHYRSGNGRHLDVDTVVDLSPYPEDQRRLWEAHIHALVRYHPQPYSGEVTLFRSPGHQLLCSFDEEYGWGEFAQGGVNVKIISGAHEQILEEPHVQRVAQQLRLSLEEARRKSVARNNGHSSGSTRTDPVPEMTPLENFRSDQAPLTPAQERLLPIMRKAPDDFGLNVCESVELHGSLDLPALEKSVRQCVQDYDVFRTKIIDQNGTINAVVSNSIQGELEQIDLSAIPEPERASELLKRARLEAFRPFDLASGCLLRATLLRFGSAQFVFALSAPRLVADESSMRSLLGHIADNYERIRDGLPVIQRDRTLSFTQWANWQHDAISRRTFADDTLFWKKHLEGVTQWGRLSSPSAGRDARFKSRIELLKLPGPLFQALKRFGQREAVTLLMTLVAACGVLVYRYSRQENFALATAVSVRNRSEIKNFIGLLSNLIACNAGLTRQLTFKELLVRVKNSLTQGEAHRTAPFELALEQFPPSLALTQDALVPLIVEAQSIELPRFAGLSASPFELGVAAVPAEVALSLNESAGEGVLRCAFNEAIFDSGSIKRALGHLQVIIQQVLDKPETAISAISILPAAELQQVVHEWNKTSKDYPSDEPYNKLFEQQVRRNPEAIAVRFGGSELTYKELNSRANQLAHYLHKSGIGPESLVAVHAERSIEFAVGLLAVFKSGAGYLPLDPGFPKERVAWMINNSRAQLVLTLGSLAGKLPAVSASVICLDDRRLASELACQDPNAAPHFVHSPDNLAYVIYTSGSTGTPKGVEITYRALLNHNCATKDAFGLRAPDRVLQFTPLSFDISIEEILPTWLAGAMVLFRNQEVLGSISKFLAFVEREAITVANLPTAYFHALAESLQALALPSTLRLMIIGGEKVSAEHWALWHKHSGNAQLMNAYGLTETTVTSTIFIADGNLARRSVPIGRPIANTMAYILDEALQPVPIGVAGELFIGGLGVARGYRNAPELTTPRFVVNPFVRGRKQFLYRTGDLARFLPDGNIEFLGRLDDQVKLRGFRIQLGEIEAALCRHPAVSSAVVHALAYGDREERLVAYFVPAEGGFVSTGELINFLQKTLPEYMIPSAFVKMEALPLTANGKVDHKALPLPGTSRPALNQTFVAPRGDLEEKIARVWREVLHLDEVGVNDNFFDLGGHSLHAMQVMGRLGDALNLDLPVSNLFEAPTVAQLSAAITACGPQTRSAVPGPAPRKADDLDLPLSFAQQRLWFLHQLQPDMPLYNLPQAVRLSGRLNVGALEKTFKEIVRRHEVLRTTYQMRSGQPAQVISPATGVSIAWRDLTAMTAENRERKLRDAIIAEARKPFALESDLMLRATLLKLAPEEHMLLVTTHHIAADGWSVEVLWKEIASLYGAFLHGSSSPLPDLPIQYADFALWQHDWLKGETLETQLAYWRKQLQGAPALLELPLDRPRAALQTYRGARHPIAIGAELTDSLRALAQAEGCTLFMTLLAGFESLLSRYAGAEDVVVGTVIANRNRPELEKLIGFFANTLVLRTNFSGDPTFREVLQRTRKTTLDAYAHQDLPFERLVEELQPARDRSYHPVFQVMLVLQNVPIPSQPLPGLALVPSDTDTGFSKFDLLLNIVETGAGLSGFIEYSTELFELPTIERMGGHLQTFLQDAVSRPDIELARLRLLPENERQQLLVEWNAERIELPPYTCIHEMFEAHAASAPQSIALICGEERVTYRELNTRANQLARHLASLGIGRESLVGICAGRNAELIVAILGTLKAGAAYVPMDPAYPKDRLHFIMQDARMPVVLTQSAFTHLLDSSEARLVCLDTDRTQIQAQSPDNLNASVQRDNLAYVIFTSGSTGRPKGVAIEHRSVLSLAAWAQSTFSRDELGGVLAGTSVCFDLSIFEILVPLALGGRVILAENVLQLPHLAARDEVRLINTVPSAMTELLRERGVPASVQTVNLAGEPLAQSLVESIYELPQVRRVFDLYGPTEATVYSTFALRTRGGRTYIGRPLPSEQAYILDRKMEPVPLGVSGELFIAGAGLARGYLNQPELTAERFVPNPFSDDPQSRMYRTGDLVRYLPDRNIEYLGRIDHQVKIRGFRIELGEIETQLRSHKAITSAVVIADQDHSGDKRLVAYVVPSQQPAPSSAELREHLKCSLPEYMVPSLFVVLEALPLTPNGKVDRKALPKPGARLARNTEGSDDPRTDAEILLAQIWSEVLGVPRVGLHDNFFDLGGHSLMITRVLSRLRESLQIELPMKSLFEAPTVASLTVLVENALVEQINNLTDEEVAQLDETMEDSVAT